MAIENKGTLLFVCETPQNTDLTAVQFAALVWDPICCLTDVPALGESFAAITAMCMDGTKLSGVGASEDSDFDISVFYESDCDGQDVIRDNVGSNNNFAFKLTRSDGSATTTPTTIYVRAKLRAKSLGSNGGADEFTADTYTATISQGPLFVKPAAI